MAAVFIWCLTYVLPALCADTFIALFPERRTVVHRRSAEVMHAMLIVSALASQYVLYRAGEQFPWELNASVILYALGVLLAFGSVGKLGIWYGLSALIQEFAMLSIAFFLFSFFSLGIVIALIVPIFVISHPLRARHWVIRLLIISFWGIASVSLFYLFHNIWLVAALHTVLGAIFIRQGILYPRHRQIRKHFRSDKG
jgi:hypothetical protein